jgi:glycosyltransferase involved in cell wall biosynthesis
MSHSAPDDAQETPLLSVIIPVRNRAGVRLENCLRSLRWQVVEDANIEIVISDFGSDETYRQAIQSLGDTYGCRVVYTATQDLWNRSRALNIGVRAAEGKYLLCTDADMIFQGNFLQALLDEQRAGQDKAFILCRCRDLPESVEERSWAGADYAQLLDASDYRERFGVGACQMATRDFFMHIHGYDEGYVFWGCEDRDLHFRSERFGLETRWVHERTSMLHQWHPTLRGERPFRKMLNDIRFHITKYRVVKNGKRWGV